MSVAFSVLPLGVGGYVPDAVCVARGSGLPNRTDAMFPSTAGGRPGGAASARGSRMD